MTEYVEALKTGDMNNGEMRAVSIQGKEILLARVDDRFYAVGNKCPHLGANLAGGRLDGTVITCPRHASQFDVKDGHVVRWTDWSGAMLKVSKQFRSPRPLPTYPVRTEDDRVLVEV